MSSTPPTDRRRPSLRGRLLGLLVAGTGLVWAAIAVATFIDARHHAARLFDAQLVEYSEVLGGLVSQEAYHFEGEVTRLEHGEEHACTYQVFGPGDRLVIRSEDAPAIPLTAAEGFADVEAAGARWRAFRRAEPATGLAIIVAHRTEERDALTGGIARRLLVPTLLGLPLLALAIWLAVARAMAPLDRLAAEVAGREAGRLVPVDAARVPREIEPLVAALNELFTRLERAFESERRFTGDAAHELRTPLAALRTNAEVALTTASDDRRQRSLDQVIAGVDRAAALVDQLLLLARVDAAEGVSMTDVDLGAAVLAAQEEVERAAAARRVRLVRRATPGAVPPVRGEAGMLQALARNLLENAVRHAGEGGEVRVTLEREGPHVALRVADSGPGVPEPLLERIFDRHFRVPGETGGAGGLGLSIARRVAELHGGTITARRSAQLGGLEVRASFPAADKESLRWGAKTGRVASPTTQE